MGVACHDVFGRVAASMGRGDYAQPKFSTAEAVPGAGVLCALPALMANGLLAHSESCLEQPKGYYSLRTLLLLFAFLALARVTSLERMRYLPPGEWGRLLGLDRIPEVKTARSKIDEIATEQSAAAWAKEMSSFWMNLDEGLAGVLYVDGHVRIYSGEQTKQPRRFSSRNRLCMRSLMDYWVNDQQGNPFFVVTAVGTEGMLHYLRETIIPRLLDDVPGQPTQEELQANKDLHRFILVFDREGWSPAFFAELWREHRIAVISYRKGNFDAWDESEFESCNVTGAFGNVKAMKLAERPFAHAGVKATEEKAAVIAREIRRSCDKKEHQTSVITTVRIGNKETLAGYMFLRWSQENYFKYASSELGIDRLAGYVAAEAPEGQSIKNPDYIQIDATLRGNLAEIRKVQAQRASIILASNESKDVEKFLIEQNAIDEQIQQLKTDREELLAQRKGIPKQIKIADLPEENRPKIIAPVRTQFLNTIRMIAYRAETALVTVLREHLSRLDDARAMVKALFKQDADMIFDQNKQTLTIRVHNFTNLQSSKAIAGLLEHLNHAEIDFPSTQIRLKYEMVSNPNPRGQEV